ncbi:hypothetical protein AUI06_05860 [archaeon 13_2_20CM_2_52_21]|nr:MAG: hypothetical protein AUI06_05860 [archaeon 13_2_20CM_2_52_21]
MSVKRKILATAIVLSIIVIGAYVLLSSQSNQRGGAGGLASPSVRTFVTLTTVGVSAFITGFGFRDVISRAIATRNRMKAAQKAKRP